MLVRGGVMRYPGVVFGTILTMLVVSCAPTQTPGQGTSQAPRTASEQPAPSRTLIVGHRYEFATLATKALQSNGSLQTVRPFNASLTLIDHEGRSLPYLAETLPQLNGDSWRVFPDGRMETTYRLKPNLTWHDGQPLTSEDFVFGWRVFATPEL